MQPAPVSSRYLPDPSGQPLPHRTMELCVNAIDNGTVNTEPMEIPTKKKRRDDAKDKKHKKKADAQDIPENPQDEKMNNDTLDENDTVTKDSPNGKNDGADTTKKAKKAGKKNNTGDEHDKINNDDAANGDDVSMKSGSSSDSSSSSSHSTSSPTSAKSSGKARAKASVSPKASPKSASSKQSIGPTVEDYAMLAEELDTLRATAKTTEMELENAHGRMEELTGDLHEYEIENEYLRKKLRILGELSD